MKKLLLSFALLAAPLAAQVAIPATDITGTLTGAQGGTGAANAGKTITVGGNVTTTGAYNLIATLSGNTTLTLPLTGTLATLDGAETLTNKTLTTPILGAATATSITGPTATNLTFTGGSSGASLALGQGASGVATFNRDIRLNASAATMPTGGLHGQILQSSTGGSGIFPFNSLGNLVLTGRDSASHGVAIMTGAGLANVAGYFTGTGNLLIGTTTDMSGVTGGAKIASTSASTGVGTGALQVAGGIYAGAASVFGSTATFAGAVTTNGSLFTQSASLPELRISDTNGVGTFGQTFYSGTTYEASIKYATNLGVMTIDAGRNAAWGSKIDLYVDTTRSVRFAKNLTTFDQPATFAGAVTVGGVTILKNYTVDKLPDAASYTYGEAYVSDATQAAGTSIGSAPTGGGSVVRGVYSNGSAWLLR